ncbi:CD276 antigen-like [Solea senegalensis]|uniref:CD276 antigen-like n=1 Tax=Solea senegalensis TaxID=28829 RepID=A0AAV6PWH1_SOLSE|nr:uncharacterized protein LOC122773051 [Solea senegalensis]KAG7479201.1 CD276 antigen-like [Solea senegalensis]
MKRKLIAVIFRQTKKGNIMVSSYTLQCTRNLGRSLQLAALIWIVSISVTESVTPILRGEVGGNVTFRCPVNKTRTIIFIYFQSGDKFVNGYHTIRDKEMPEPWGNTKMDRNKAHIDMIRLNISHNGVYRCIIRYNDNNTPEVHNIKLAVTANYSKPSVETTCDDGNLGCVVTCSSHGGYPKTKMKLITPESGNSSTQVFKEVKSSHVSSPDTMLFNSSSTTYINCTSGQWKYLSCSVGEATSHTFSVCEPKRVPESNNQTLIIAFVVMAVIICVTIVIVSCKLLCKKKTGTTAGQMCNINGNLHENISLNPNQEGREAS